MKLSQLQGQYTVENEPAPKLSALPPGSYQIEPQKEEPGLLSKGLDYASRGLDYLGGNIRTAAATAGGLLTGNPDFVKDEDVINTLKGKAPTTAEYLERAGMGEGDVSHTPLGDISTRDLVGFAGDVVTDPLGLVAKTIRPAGKAIEGAGKGMYKSAFKKIDERLAEKGAKSLGDVLLEHGAPTGTTKSLKPEIDKISKGLLEKRSGLYKQAEDLGATVDVEKASRSALEEAQKLKGTRGAEDLGQDLEQKIASLYELPGTKMDYGTLQVQKSKLPPLSISEASDLKTRLRDVLPDKAFDKFGRVKKDAQSITKKQAAGLRQEIISEANKVRPGLGDEIDALNMDLGSIIESQQPLKMQIRRGETPNAVTSVDAMLGALTTPGALATKKAADLSKTAWLRTKLGKQLMNVGESGAVDPLILRGLINSGRPAEE